MPRSSNWKGRGKVKKLKKINNGNGLTVVQKKMQELAENKLSDPNIAEWVLLEALTLFLLGNVIGMYCCAAWVSEQKGLSSELELPPELNTINLARIVQDAQRDLTLAPDEKFRACLPEVPLLHFISYLV